MDDFVKEPKLPGTGLDGEVAGSLYAEASAIMTTVVRSMATPNAAQISHGLVRRMLKPISATTSQAVAMTSASNTAPSNLSMRLI